jgi:hypothetical protein
MMTANLSDTLRRSFVHAAGVVVYVAAIALLFFHAEGIFGDKSSFLIPVMLLLLFIVSATITGLLVLGRPAQLYLDGAKRDAIAMLAATVGWLIVFLVAVAVLLALT